MCVCVCVCEREREIYIYIYINKQTDGESHFLFFYLLYLNNSYNVFLSSIPHLIPTDEKAILILYSQLEWVIVST